MCLQVRVQKYYARAMKGNMTRDEFNAWVEHAAAESEREIESWQAVLPISVETSVLESFPVRFEGFQ